MIGVNLRPLGGSKELDIEKSPTPQKPEIDLGKSQTTNESDIAKNERASMELQQQFWEKNVSTFTIKHGTSSIYRKHFQDYGISSSYPKPLEDLIDRVRKVWTNHEHDIMKRTAYFKMFEQRYDEAHQNQKLYFLSANNSITSEYTTGSKRIWR